MSHVCGDQIFVGVMIYYPTMMRCKPLKTLATHKKFAILRYTQMRMSTSVGKCKRGGGGRDRNNFDFTDNTTLVSRILGVKLLLDRRICIL